MKQKTELLTRLQELEPTAVEPVSPKVDSDLFAAPSHYYGYSISEAVRFGHTTEAAENHFGKYKKP